MGVALLLAADAAPAGELPGDLAAEVAARGIDPERIVYPLTLTGPMRAWAKERVAVADDPEVTLRRLLEALLEPGDPGLRYVLNFTGTAREVFEGGEANCLSFTNLFVALARDLGVDAYFLEVEREPRYDQEGDLVVVFEHVTAGYGPPSHRLVLEFALGPPITTARSRRLSDLTAVAMYYSNRGAELLRSGRQEEAREWLETAIALDPGWPTAWLNLGVARRRTGDGAGAEAAYLAAIEADPDHLQAYHNLAALLRRRGERDAAGRLLEVLGRRGDRDPFIHLALGDGSLEAGLLEEARRYYRRALRLAPRVPEVMAAMGLWAHGAGHPRRAERWLRRARRQDPGAGTSRVQLLAARLAADRREEVP